MKKNMLAMSAAACWTCVFFMFFGCASAPQAPPAATSSPSKVTLAPGDEIEIKFAYSQEFNETQKIRQDGKIETAVCRRGCRQRAKLLPLCGRSCKSFSGSILNIRNLPSLCESADDNRVFVGGEVNNAGGY